MTLRRPQRRRPERMGVKPDARKARVNEAHKRWVRGHECAVKGLGCDGRMEAAHVTWGLPAGARRQGKGIKAGDEWVVALCRSHHAEQHQIGGPAFERRYMVDLVKLAEQYAAASPHLKAWAREKETQP